MDQTEKNQEWKAWYNSRPQKVKDLIDKYPPGAYRIKEGAPYAISCSGTVVNVIGYNENNEVVVVILPFHKMPSAIEHEKALCKKHNSDYEKIKDTATTTHVSADWIEPLKENEFQCDLCKKVYDKGWSDEVAAEEAKKVYGSDIFEIDDTVAICDPCYKEHIDPEKHPEELKKTLEEYEKRRKK